MVRALYTLTYTYIIHKVHLHLTKPLRIDLRLFICLYYEDLITNRYLEHNIIARLQVPTQYSAYKMKNVIFVRGHNILLDIVQYISGSVHINKHLLNC